MPGVPSGRGCNNCRKQKKKCDQLHPCSRCARLCIACIGSGQQRFKFIGQPQSLTRNVTQTDPRQRRSTSVVPSRVPNNELDSVTDGFLSAIAVTDIRFDLSIYGAFLEDIPRRLGRNEALDAAVQALTTALPSVRSHQYSTNMYKTYMGALRQLRYCLSDPEKAASPETLCAVYLIMICQGWLGKKGDPSVSHGEAIAHMLNTAAARGWQGRFETDMIKALSMIVVLQSFSNPKIRLDPCLWTSDGATRPLTPAADAYQIESLQLRNLTRVSDFCRDVSGHLPEIRAMYGVLRVDCAKIAGLLAAVPPTTTANLLPLPARRLQVRQQTSYGILLLLAIMGNGALRADDPTDSALEDEADLYVDEAITLAQQAAQYRPLGSSAMPLCLIAAWSVTDDVAKQAQLGELIAEYQSDFDSTNWLDLAVSVKPRLG